MCKGRPKKDSVSLPEWFDIQKYKSARDLDAMGWCDQLVFRGNLLIGIEDCRREGDTEFKRLETALKLLYDDPLITEERVKQTISLVVDDETEKDGNTVVSGHLAVDPVVGFTLRAPNGTGLKILTAVHRKDIEPPENEEGIIAESEFSVDEPFEFTSPPLRWKERPVIALDLSLTDEVLVQDMRGLLRNLRKTEKAPHHEFTKNSEFLKWYNSGALPYLDLVLWEEMGHEFKGAAFINELSLILDAPISSEGAALKSASIYARKLLNGHTIRTLAAQVAREGSDGSKKSGKLLMA
jgi:hypothetical protein